MSKKKQKPTMPHTGVCVVRGGICIMQEIYSCFDQASPHAYTIYARKKRFCQPHKDSELLMPLFGFEKRSQP